MMRLSLVRLSCAIALAATLSGCMASTQQEVELGQQYAAQINQQLPIVTDPEINRYINVLGDSIATLSDDRGLQWHFYVVNDRELNAFAVPGGYIYVNRGIIEASDNLSQLAGVMGHEIGHVLERHSMEQMRDMERANAGVSILCIFTSVCESQAAGAAINLAGSAVFAKFSREDEAEADAVGIRNVVRAGIDPRGIPAMFRKLLDARQSDPSAVSAFFSTHPLEEDRIAATEAQIAQIDPAILESLTRDTPAFQAFKRRVAALPAPPPRK
ncbi:MAG TPA: M48 family metallopeptidase [Gemmatimonadaceae bacterium]|nr:M48 family metallopeptidase [Gemmatimonadaceae bacterium]